MAHSVFFRVVTMSNFDVVIVAVGLILLITAFSLHIFGLYVLSWWKHERTQQSRVLTHISLMEMLLLVTLVPYWLSVCSGGQNGTLVVIFDTLNHSCAISVALLLMILTTDRIIACGSPLRYWVYVTKKRMRLALRSTWVFGVVLFFISNSVRAYLLESNIYKLYENGLLSVFYLITFFYSTLSYIYIYRKMSLFSIVGRRGKLKRQCNQSSLYRRSVPCSAIIRYSTKRDSVEILKKRLSLIKDDIQVHVSGGNIERRAKSRLHKVSVLILFSFSIFSLVPTITAVIVNEAIGLEYGRSPIRSLLNLGWQMNFVCTPLIYVFMNRKSRHLLRRKVNYIFKF